MSKTCKVTDAAKRMAYEREAQEGPDRQGTCR